MTLRRYWSLIGLILLFSLIVGMRYPLSQDEAYYWVWSRHLQLSYYDHPPMIAYFIKLTTTFGSSTLAVRMVSILCYGGAASLLYNLTQRLSHSQTTAQWASLIYLLMPLTQWSLVAVSPGAPQTLFWASSLYLLHHYLETDKLRYMYGCAISVGCLLLSKYTGLLIYPVILSVLLFSEQRRCLLTPHPYLALLLSALIASPIMIWNAHHDWSSLLYQYHHGMAENQPLNLDTWSEYLASQWIAFNPIFSTALGIGLWRHGQLCWRDASTRFLLIPWAFVIIFFGYEALFKRELTYWPEPAWWSASALTAILFSQYGWAHARRIALIAAAAFMGTVKLCGLIPGTTLYALASQQALPNPLIHRLNQTIAPTLSPSTQILSDSWQNASLVEFNFFGQPSVTVLQDATTPGQFQYWSIGHHPHNRSILYIGEQKGASTLRARNPSCQPIAQQNFAYYYRRFWQTRSFVALSCSPDEATQ